MKTPLILNLWSLVQLNKKNEYGFIKREREYLIGDMNSGSHMQIDYMCRLHLPLNLGTRTIPPIVPVYVLSLLLL